MFNNLNENKLTWKKYPNKLVKNGHNMLEMKVNLTDTELMGSGDNFEPMKEVLSRFQLSLNEVQKGENSSTHP